MVHADALLDILDVKVERIETTGDAVDLQIAEQFRYAPNEYYVVKPKSQLEPGKLLFI